VRARPALQAQRAVPPVRAASQLAVVARPLPASQLEPASAQPQASPLREQQGAQVALAVPALQPELAAPEERREPPASQQEVQPSASERPVVQPVSAEARRQLPSSA
jgi:hypothetical protein